jgi:cytochrome c biogenesis protein CcdA/glutaredoxin
MKTALLLAMLLCLSHAIDIEFYYGEGCPHCAATLQLFDTMKGDYDLDITEHEVYYDASERISLMAEYEHFGFDINQGGVPTSIVAGNAMIIGGLSEEQWRQLFDLCEEGKCPSGVFSYNKFDIEDSSGEHPDPQDIITDPMEEKNPTAVLTLPVIIGAAIVDSVNPCTLAVMIMLLGAILYADGKRRALVSGLIFSAVIFIMYMLYGLGIMTVIATYELSSVFYVVVTVGALLLSVMEFNAYFRYKPGFFAVEMPMFIRPYAKKVTSDATSPIGVAVAAVLCSLFLVPCSSGPYLVVLGMLAKAATLLTISYLVLYNLFFILPMVIITVAIYMGKTSVEKVGKAKDRYIKEIHLFSGVILLILFLLMLNQLVGGF